MQILLEKTGGQVSALQGAYSNLMSADFFDGYGDGFLNNFDVFVSANNAISINTGLVQIRGFRILNNEMYTQTIPSLPSQPINYQLIISLDIRLDSENSSHSISIQPERALRQDNIFKNGDGIYEAEIAKFTLSSSGITNFQKTLQSLDIAGADIPELIKIAENALEIAAAADEKADIAISNSITAISDAALAKTAASAAAVSAAASASDAQDAAAAVAEGQGSILKVNTISQAVYEAGSLTGEIRMPGFSSAGGESWIRLLSLSEDAFASLSIQLTDSYSNISPSRVSVELSISRRLNLSDTHVINQRMCAAGSAGLSILGIRIVQNASASSEKYVDVKVSGHNEYLYYNVSFAKRPLYPLNIIGESGVTIPAGWEATKSLTFKNDAVAFSNVDSSNIKNGAVIIPTPPVNTVRWLRLIAYNTNIGPFALDIGAVFNVQLTDLYNATSPTQAAFTATIPSRGSASFPSVITQTACTADADLSILGARVLIPNTGNDYSPRYIDVQLAGRNSNIYYNVTCAKGDNKHTAFEIVGTDNAEIPNNYAVAGILSFVKNATASNKDVFANQKDRVLLNRQIYSGTNTPYQWSVIPLVKFNTTQAQADSMCDVRLLSRTTNGNGILGSFDISFQRAYSPTDFTYYKYAYTDRLSRETATVKFGTPCSFMYNNQRYLGVKIAANTTPGIHLAYGYTDASTAADTAAYTLIPYRDSDTGEVFNQEIYDSVIECTADQSAELRAPYIAGLPVPTGFGVSGQIPQTDGNAVNWVSAGNLVAGSLASTVVNSPIFDWRPEFGRTYIIVPASGASFDLKYYNYSGSPVTFYNCTIAFIRDYTVRVAVGDTSWEGEQYIDAEAAGYYFSSVVKIYTLGEIDS